MGGSKSKERLSHKTKILRQTPIHPVKQTAPCNNLKYFITDKFSTYEELEQGLRKAGIEACQLIVGVDFTKSNEWQGEGVYTEKNLHSMLPYPNPYQQVLQIMCNSLASFDDDGLIPSYGFGDVRTIDKFVFSFAAHQNGVEAPCFRLEGVLQAYNSIISNIKMSGPTTFAPLIYKAIEIVKISKQYHILLIICDGGISAECEKQTISAIVEASKYPLSIVCIGVGKGPWDMMEYFDDKIMGGKFDNFQFVNFHKMMHQCENVEVEFAKNALMEIPEQYDFIKKNLF